MGQEILTPKHIWIVTGETSVRDEKTGQRDGEDQGGLIGRPSVDERETGIVREAVDLEKLKGEMKGFLQAMREILNEADPPDSKMTLSQVELSVEINGEGQVSLFGIGGKAGGKGAMIFKFIRADDN